MKTAEEWRTWYYITRGRTVTPASLLDDLLRDMEELEHTIRFLQAIVATRDGVEVDI